MTIDVDAVYEDTPGGEVDDPTGWKTAMELRGCIKDAPPDMAENHDKYLYGDLED